MIRGYILCFILVSLLGASAQTMDWTKGSEYFPVYTFTKNTMGLVIDVDYPADAENKVVDKILKDVKHREEESVLVDSLGEYQFFWNGAIEDALMKGIGKRFFVYCTKGVVVERKVKDVVYAQSVCYTNPVVFRFDKIDTATAGYPVFCTANRLPVQFGDFPAITKGVEVIIKKEALDYVDSIPVSVFAKSDSLFFAYSDNFNWYGKTLPRCFFPGRSIYVQKGAGMLRRKWAVGLDLFGIPCD